ncbi:MAG: DUF5985 family protein [Alphaproteobacteria bacterium]
MIGFQAIVYLLCFLSSTLCFYLLLSGYRRQRERLLLWSSLCFGLLALNNLLVFLDIIVLPDFNLVPLRSLTALGAVALLLYGFIWEIE